MYTNRCKLIIAAILGTFFLYFSNGRCFFPLAAWLYPLLFLYVTRRMKPLKGYLAAAVLSAVITQFSFWNFSSSNPANPLFYLPAVMGLMLGLPFLADRLIQDKFKGFLSTLVFPLAYTAVDILYGTFSPFGTTGVLGYSQYGFAPLVQLASVTGIWGITFVVTWFGSFMNWVMEHVSEIGVIKKPVAAYSLIMAAVLTYGSIRLLIPLQEGTVRVAGIHVYDLRGAEGKAVWAAVDAGDRETFRQQSQSIQDRLFAMTHREAQAGAKIIVWSEISPPVAGDDEAAFMQRAKETAAAEGIYLVVAPYVIPSDPAMQEENKLFILDPTGNVVLTHYKFGGNFLEGTLKGDGILHTADTPYGRLSGVICWDQDFPAVMSQAGRQRVDILLAPTADWVDIDPIHTVVGYFRAVENGYGYVRQAVTGLSLASDAKGRVLAQMDHFTSSEWVMVAQVPAHGMFTLYPYIGDAFGWLCAAGFVWMAVVGVRRGNRKNQAGIL